ncbi:hypothetical protein L3N51_02256 [Metallosphaera sp. J1]|nr:hypothetical protein [Metallosphaera javensis (ex Hofmann et al. 2022)]MCG3109959.1 hypothetical protein [Metallosphaera javensis (ex Hofmann et al. 2022)]BCS91515.1 MAG: hypothetical protein MjAS7_0123 [Metallosphaera javensis (ex Sakai et al. 2022)]
MSSDSPLKTGKVKRIRDPIYGLITVDEKPISSPTFRDCVT